MRIFIAPARRWSTLTHLLLLMLPASLGAGCAWVRGPAGPGLATPVSPDSLASDSLQVTTPDSLERQTETKKPPKKTVARTPTPVAPPTPTPPETTEPPRVDISVQITEEQRTQLALEARGRIRETNRILQGVDSSAFSQPKLDALVTIRGLLNSASQALDEGDVQAADSLARKALLLASDLPPS